MIRQPHSDPVSRFHWLALLLLAGGAAAWLIVLAVFVLVVLDGDQPAPPAAPMIPSTLTADSSALRPTLAAQTATPLPTAAPTVMPTVTPTSSPAPSLTPTPLPPPITPLAQAALASPTPPAATPPPATDCAPPADWEQYVVQQGDTLFAFQLGADSAVTVDDLMAANCLSSRFLQVGQTLYLPPGAAENAPPSEPYVPTGSARGPRPPNCPCTINVAAGWRREQIADAIDAAQTMFTGADFLAVTGPDAGTTHDVLISRPPGASLEGYLFPGSYTVYNDTTAEAFRDMLLGAFAANVSPQMQADAAAQGVTFYQALIIASIVQREVHGPETQKLVASVYYNRFRSGNRLAATVTVQYALGRPGNWWPRVTGSQLEIDSPYNSYTRPGLPPAPISSPGLSAIVAAIYAPQTNYYYHTASCDGSGEAFAETYEEHLQNVNCE